MLRFIEIGKHPPIYRSKSIRTFARMRRHLAVGERSNVDTLRLAGLLLRACLACHSLNHFSSGEMTKTICHDVL